MDRRNIIAGIVAPLPMKNLDTDQIMPKQFLKGIDKAGLAAGVLYDLRFDGQGIPRADFVLNRPEYNGVPILVAGANFGCGSSREHAVWGLQQFGVRAVIASSFGEIFYSNAMNNGLMLATVSEQDVQRLMNEAVRAASGMVPATVQIDVANRRVASTTGSVQFAISDRHRHMFLHGLGLLGASLLHLAQIQAFAQQWHQDHPWLKNVASSARARLDEPPGASGRQVAPDVIQYVA